jgi:hypothetical protein
MPRQRGGEGSGRIFGASSPLSSISSSILESTAHQPTRANICRSAIILWFHGPRISFNLVLSAMSAGDPAGRRSHASNVFLVNRCCVPGSLGSTVNSCSPFGSYCTCSQRRKRSIASPRPRRASGPPPRPCTQFRPHPLKDTRHCFTPSKISYSSFLLRRHLWLSDYFPRLRVLAQAHKP